MQQRFPRMSHSVLLLRMAIDDEPCTGETYEQVELGQKVRSEGQQGYRQGN